MMASQTIKEKFVELQKSKQTPQNPRPKIQRVAYYRRKISNFEKHYTPKLVSIGPIHHDNADLKLGEKYKLMWASKYIENTGLIPEELHKKIADNIDELKGRFSDDVLTLTGKSLEGYGSLEEKLSWILFVDGCSLLHILEGADLAFLELMNIKVDQLVFMKMDVLLLENQLPYEVLKLLWKGYHESELIESMTNFLSGSHCDAPDESQSEKGKDVISNREHIVSIRNESPTHLLDLHRKIILTTSNSKTKSNEAADMKWSQKLLQKIKKWSQKKKNDLIKPITYTGIEDLRAVGITLEPSFTDRLTDIVFSEGWFTEKLTIPIINVNNFTASTLLNLIAYEMCPDFDNDYGFCSYVAFMDSLIDHPEDVKALRSNGIMYTLWSNEDVAKLFNTMGTDLVPNNRKYLIVNIKLDEIYRNRYKTWIGLGFRAYFNPMAFYSFTAALIALILTYIQTWFTVNPPSK